MLFRYKRYNRDFLCYFLSINVQFLELENLTSTSASIAMCVTDHLSVCMYIIYNVILSRSSA